MHILTTCFFKIPFSNILLSILISATWLLHVILFHKILYAFLISPFVPIALLNTPPPFLPCIIIIFSSLCLYLPHGYFTSYFFTKFYTHFSFLRLCQLLCSTPPPTLFSLHNNNILLSRLISATWLLHVIFFHKILYAFLISPFVPIALLNTPHPPFLPCIMTISDEQILMQFMAVVSHLSQTNRSWIISILCSVLRTSVKSILLVSSKRL